MDKLKQEKPKLEKEEEKIVIEQEGYLPASDAETDSEETSLGLPQLNQKDWKKSIGCGG